MINRKISVLRLLLMKLRNKTVKKTMKFVKITLTLIQILKLTKDTSRIRNTKALATLTMTFC